MIRKVEVRSRTSPRIISRELIYCVGDAIYCGGRYAYVGTFIAYITNVG